MPEHIQNVEDGGTILKRVMRPRSFRERLFGDIGCGRRPESKGRGDCHLGPLGWRRYREGRTSSVARVKGSLLQGSRGHGGRKARSCTSDVAHLSVELRCSFLRENLSS